MGTCHVEVTKGILVVLLSEPGVVVLEAKLADPDVYNVLVEMSHLSEGYNYQHELIIDEKGVRTKPWRDT